MAARTPREALDGLTEPLQLSLACVTDAVLNCRRYGNRDYPNEHPHTLIINYGQPVSLLCDDDALFFSFRMAYRIIRIDDGRQRGPWKATIVSYYYSLDDADEREILAYHWRPITPPAEFPHLHVAHGSGERLRPEYAHAHLPTGRIALEDVVLCMIRDFHVHPLRPDWQSLLEANREQFRAVRTWN